MDSYLSKGIRTIGNANKFIKDLNSGDRVHKEKYISQHLILTWAMSSKCIYQLKFNSYSQYFMMSASVTLTNIAQSTVATEYANWIKYRGVRHS